MAPRGLNPPPPGIIGGAGLRKRFKLKTGNVGTGIGGGEGVGAGGAEQHHGALGNCASSRGPSSALGGGVAVLTRGGAVSVLGGHCAVRSGARSRVPAWW